MFQSLVITLREGVEATLIIGIVLAYLAKTGRKHLNRVVYAAVLAALVASVLAALLLHGLGITEDFYEGWLMLAGAAFVATMVVWMWRTGKRLKQEIETKLSGLPGGLGSGPGAGLFALVFLLVLREGIETVVFLAAVSLRTSDLMSFIGGVIGVGLAVGLGVAIFKGSVKVNLRKFFTVTSLVLAAVAAQLLVSGVHELSEAQVLPSSRREMALVGPLVNNDTFFFLIMVALCLFLVAAQKPEAPVAHPGAGVLTSPERRKALAEEQGARFWKMTATAVSLVIVVAFSAQYIYSRAGQEELPSERLSLAGGVLRMPAASLADRKLHRFVVGMEGVDVRLIAILDSSDTVRAGLDACQICGTQGYYQDGRNVICKNCAAAIFVPTIGMAGGCNPIRVRYQVEGDSITFSEDALRDAARVLKK